MSALQNSSFKLAAGWNVAASAEPEAHLFTPSQIPRASEATFPLGTIPALQTFNSLYRFSPFWVAPHIGNLLEQVRRETIWLLARDHAQRFLLLVPLVGGTTRFSLTQENETLVVVAETGDANVHVTQSPALLLVEGNDAYEVIARGARALSHTIGTPLRAARANIPRFAEKLGWCTWDAFYKDVSPARVLDGLRSFAEQNIPIKTLILDDGWQARKLHETGEELLTQIAPNERFEGTLKTLFDAAKRDFGIENTIAWHALFGYWGGLDPLAFPDFGVTMKRKKFGNGVLALNPEWNEAPWGAQQGIPTAQFLANFFKLLHASLARDGADGVKIDVQGMIEAVAHGQGGRVAFTRWVRDALETSVATQFDGEMLQCMAVTQEHVYLSQRTTLMRTSDDFFPTRIDSHGIHVWCNAIATLWFGEFMFCDWDMFQSTHRHAAFHAAARAISGGPIYVSDNVGAHNAALLTKLALSDGTILRLSTPAKPTRESLFDDPTTSPNALKLFNRHRDATMIGAFHCGGVNVPLSTSTRLDDIPEGRSHTHFVAWAHRANRFWSSPIDEPPAFILAPLEWELVTFAPMENGCAFFGLAEKFCSVAAIDDMVWDFTATTKCAIISLRDGGRFLAWSESKPLRVTCNQINLAADYDAKSKRLEIDVPMAQISRLFIEFVIA